MFGTSIGLTTLRILEYSKEQDIDFEQVKLIAVKIDFLKTIKRLNNFELYKHYQSIVENISTKQELLTEIDKLGESLSNKGLDTKKIKLYADYAKRTLDATKESSIKTYSHMLKDIDTLTPIKECKMSNTIKKFDKEGNIIPLFKKDENGQVETFVDDKGVTRYLLNNDILDWSDSKSFYKFAKKHNFKIHGHTIVWHETVPYQIQELASSDISADIKKKMTQDFLYSYMKSYAEIAKQKGVKLESIDILNEIANDNQNSKDFLRTSTWRDLMGDNYYIDVLKMAKQVFPNTKLMYNDFSEFYPAKRNNIIQIIKNIQEVEKNENIQLLDCVGLQCHLYGDELDYDKAFKEFNEIAKNGIFPKEVRITELDSSPCNNPKWQQEQMKSVVESAEKNGIKNITCWEFAGQFSDSIEKSENSGVVDEKGDKTDVYNQISQEHSEKQEHSKQAECIME